MHALITGSLAVHAMNDGTGLPPAKAQRILASFRIAVSPVIEAVLSGTGAYPQGFAANDKSVAHASTKI